MGEELMDGLVREQLALQGFGRGGCTSAVLISCQPQRALHALARLAPDMKHTLLLEPRQEIVAGLAERPLGLPNALKKTGIFVPQLRARNVDYALDAYTAVMQFLLGVNEDPSTVAFLYDPRAMLLAKPYRGIEAAVRDLSQQCSEGLVRQLLPTGALKNRAFEAWASHLANRGQPLHALRLQLAIAASRSDASLDSAIQETGRAAGAQQLLRSRSGVHEVTAHRVAVATRTGNGIAVERRAVSQRVQMEGPLLVSQQPLPDALAPTHRTLVVGEVSSATILLHRLVETACDQGRVLHSSQVMLNTPLRNPQRLNNETLQTQLVGSGPWLTLDQHEAVRQFSYGWSHQNPGAFDQSPLYRACKKIFVHRDGRDVVASFVAARGLAEGYGSHNLVDAWSEETPAYYRCRTEDLRKSVVLSLAGTVLRWQRAALEFCERRDDFLEVKFEDITSDPRGTGRIEETVQRILKHTNTPGSAERVVEALGARRPQATAYRGDTRKIGRHLEFFEPDTLEAVQNRLGMGLVVLGYLPLREFSSFIADSNECTLLARGNEAVVEQVQMFFRIIDKPLRVQPLPDDLGGLDAGGRYLLCTDEHFDLTDMPQVQYLPFYLPFEQLDLPLFDARDNAPGRGSALSGRRVALLGSASERRFCQAFLVRRGVQCVELEIDCGAPEDVDAVVVTASTYRRNFEASQRLLSAGRCDVWSVYPVREQGRLNDDEMKTARARELEAEARSGQGHAA